MATKTIKIGLSDADKATMQAAVVALIKASLITPYSTSATYAVGDFVYYSGDGKIYKCTTAISTAESWTSGHWTEATLNDIIDAVNAAVASVNNKVEPDDICPELRAGYAFTADNLNATKGLTVNDDPMSYGIVGGAQKSAVGDGNASLNKLVCVDVVKNQLSPELNLTNWEQTNGNSIDNLSVNDGEAVVTSAGEGTLGGNGIRTVFSLSNIFSKGHYYLVKVSVKASHDAIVSGSLYRDGYGTSTLFSNQAVSTSYTDFYGIAQLNSEETTKYALSFGTITTNRLPNGATISFKNILLIDLTQALGSNEVVNAIIGSDASTQIANLLKAFPQILTWTDYDAGTMVPSKTAKLLSVGVNQWDEEWETGYINADGTVNKTAAGATNRRTTSFIPVLPNTTYYQKCPSSASAGRVAYYDANKNVVASNIDSGLAANATFTTLSNAFFMRITFGGSYGTTYSNNICINVSDPNINGKYYPSKRNPATLPNYEGHGILKVVDGKVVADGTELYPDGNSKKRYNADVTDAKQLRWVVGSSSTYAYVTSANLPANAKPSGGIICNKLDSRINSLYIDSYGAIVTTFPQNTFTTGAQVQNAFENVVIHYELDAEEDITTPVYQSTFPVEQGGTLQFLDENDNPIAGLQGSEIFYQKNIKAFVEALGEATDWDPERIKRLGNLSFTPEYVDITLNPSPTGAYARAQVYNATFTIVISAALTGTANGSIAFQDSEVDLSNFQTKPAEAIYDMDGKKVSEAPTTTDCNIASFVGRSKSGTVMWSLLHSGVNKVKIHIEESVPLDSSGNGKIDCRASLIL